MKELLACISRISACHVMKGSMSAAQVQPRNPEVSCSFWDTERTPFSSKYKRRRDSQGLIGEGSFGRVEQCALHKHFITNNMYIGICRRAVLLP